MFYALIGALDPKLHFNDGMRRVVRFVYAPDTVTNASPPAPVSSYQAANLKLVDVILEALAAFCPQRAVANAGSSGALLISWKGSALHAIRDPGLGLRRRLWQRRRLRARDPSLQPAHHANRDSRIRVSLPHRAHSSLCRTPAAPASSAAAWRSAATTSSCRTRWWCGATTARASRRRRCRRPAGQPQPLRHPRPVRRRSRKCRPPAATSCKPASAFSCKVPGAAATAIRGKRHPAALARDIAEGYVSKEAAARDYGGTHDKSIAETPPSTNRLAP